MSIEDKSYNSTVKKLTTDRRKIGVAIFQDKPKEPVKKQKKGDSKPFIKSIDPRRNKKNEPDDLGDFSAAHSGIVWLSDEDISDQV